MGVALAIWATRPSDNARPIPTNDDCSSCWHFNRWRSHTDGCSPSSWWVFLVCWFFLFLYHVFIVMVQELACCARYGVNKTLISISKIPVINIKPAPNRVKYSTHCDLVANK